MKLRDVRCWEWKVERRGESRYLGMALIQARSRVPICREGINIGAFPSSAWKPRRGGVAMRSHPSTLLGVLWGGAIDCDIRKRHAEEACLFPSPRSKSIGQLEVAVPSCGCIVRWADNRNRKLLLFLCNTPTRLAQGSMLVEELEERVCAMGCAREAFCLLFLTISSRIGPRVAD